MDAITQLKDDHKTVEQLFKRFEKAGDRAYVEKRELVDRFTEALSIHAAIEEQLFYPVVRATVPATEELALESLEEHHIVKWVLSELDHMAPEDERFDAKVTVLIENVRHHVQEEEDDFFPRVRDELGRNALNDLGDAMVEARRTAPTRPHPRTPDTPPGNVVVGAAAGVADRIGDTVSGLAQGSVTAVGDLVATVLRRKKPRTAPRGSSTARMTARDVRGTASDVTEAAIEATRRTKEAVDRAGDTARVATTSATAGVRRTARTAKRGATGTARTAKANAQRTARAAKANAQGTARAAKANAQGTARAAKANGRSTGRAAKAKGRSTVRAAKANGRSTGRAAKAKAQGTVRAAKANGRSTGRAAKANAQGTGRTAKANGRSTATAARTSAKRTAATAKRNATGERSGR
jgi:hemerythrin superfamily protein